MADQPEAPPPKDTFLLVTLGDTRLVACATDPGPGLVPQGKALSLLTYLHCAPRRSAPRDHLIDLLWSNASGASGRQSLRQVVYRLRNTLGATALDTDRDAITLCLPLTCDRDAFLAAVRVGDHARATELYTGAFFPGFAAPGAVGFEQWADFERTHLQASFLRAAEAAISSAIDHGDPAAGARLATRVLELVPSAQGAWRLLIRSQAAAGRPSEALAAADRLDSQLAADAAAPEAETRTLLARLRSLPGSKSVELAPRRQPDLLGREPVFASLLASWRASAGGRGKVVTVQGAAGIGKTRLLQDFHQRLSSLGATVLSMRARPAERDIPYAFAATLADTIAGLPGSVGVSPSTASVLVELAPPLSSRFRHTQGSRRDPEEWLRVRSLALHDLLQVTTEDSPLVLLVDDLHWADDASRQVLSAVAGRLGDLPVLLVAGFRPMRPGWPGPDGTVNAELDPLGAEECEAMVASIAAGEPGLCAELGRLIHQTSGGVPLLALAALDVALARGVLRLEEDRWIADDVEALRGALTGGNLLEQLLADLPANAVQVLMALALAGQALEERVLSAASTTPDIGALTGMLEQRGLLLRLDTRWEVAHDRLADATLAIAPDGESDAVARRAGHALLSHPDPDAAALRLAGRLLHRGGDPATTVAFRRWLRAVNRRRYWRDPRTAAGEFLGDLNTREAVRTVVGRMSPVQRVVRGWPLHAGAAATLLVLGTIGATGDRLLTLTDPKAHSIRIIEPPSSRGFLFDSSSVGQDLDPTRIRNPIPTVVSFLDAQGRPTRRGPGSVEMRLMTEDTLGLEGPSVVPTRWGRAEFKDLVVRGMGSFVLEVTAGTLPPARSGRLHASADGGGTRPRLQILSGTVNGQRVTADSHTVRVPPGALLTGEVTLSALTTSRTAAVLLGAIGLWGDRTTNFVPLQALSPHGESRIIVPLRDPNTWRFLRAPEAPGRYRMLLALDTETEMRYIASWTNWLTGEPEWFDGNDLADLTEEDIQIIREGGVLHRPKVYVMPGNPDGRRQMPHTVVAAVIEVIVEA
ncbi:MAG TPA: AAA family ATPase [Gemmatimonadales bacterium]|nr:AAA family ATPase [Gemmatimonadales bacterium]